MKRTCKQFTVKGGRKIVDGKPRWPACLCLEMSKKEALELTQSILSQLAYSNGDTISVMREGELEDL